MNTLITKAVIFDMDGVIVNTVPFHYHSWQLLCENNNWQFNKNLNKKLLGLNRSDSLGVILKHNQVTLPEHEFKQRLQDKNTLFIELIKNFSRDGMLPGILELFTALKAEGCKLAIASSSQNVNFIVKTLQIESYFDAIIDSTMVKKAKPDPELFLLAASKTATDGENCIVIEDAEAGVTAALLANMKVIAIGNMEKLGCATKIVKTTRDITIDLIKNIFKIDNISIS